jgi:hypothetical protein
MKPDVAHVFSKPGLAVACLALAWLVESGGTALASVVVMESNVSGVQRGQELADDQRLDVPPGNHVLVGVVQNAQLKQIDIVGPRAGQIRDLLHPEPVSEKLWRLLINLTQKGGASESGFGAVRSIRATRVTRVLVNDVPVVGNVEFCVEQGTAPSIGLASGSDGASVRVSENLGGQSATLDLPAGAGHVPWPASVPLKDDTMYRITAQSSPDIVIEMHMVPSGALRNVSSVKALEVLAAHGCEQQARIALEQAPTSRQ